MAPLTKDTLDVANSAADSAVSNANIQTKPAAGHMRSDALSLEVAVRVHGSKVKEVVLGTTPHTEPFEEQTSTMIIFPQGGVLRMNTAVAVGQMLVLTNLKSRQDAICRVVKVRPNANRAAYIEVEFTQPQPAFWGAYLPSDEDPVSNKTVPAASGPTASADLSEKAKPSSEISWTPAPASSAAPSTPLDSGSTSKEPKPISSPPPVQRFVPAARPEPSFISIGSQEEVQPAASATAQIESKNAAFTPAPPTHPAATDFTTAPPVALPASFSMAELRGDDDAAPSIAAPDASAAEEEDLAAAALSTSESSRNIFGSLGGGNPLNATHSSSTGDFGARLDSGFGASSVESAKPRVNWILVAAGAAVLLTVLGGGLYFRSRATNSRAGNGNANPPAPVQQPAQTQAPSSTSSSVQSPDPNSTTPLPSVPASSSAPLNVPNGATPAVIPSPASTGKPVAGGPPLPIAIAKPAAPSGATPAVIPSPASTGKPVAGAPPLPIAIAKPAAPKVTPDMMSQSLSSHPTSGQRAGASSTEAAPVLDAPAASEGTSAALSGISSSPHVPVLAPPAIQPEGPVKIGGDVKEPRLIASAMPIYPLGARQSGVEGDVVVNTTIDKSGSVVGMRVVSGPPLLRQAALDALRRWKYEPSRLNGQPVAVEMQVTIKFRR